LAAAFDRLAARRNIDSSVITTSPLIIFGDSLNLAKPLERAHAHCGAPPHDPGLPMKARMIPRSSTP
jgi:hypothetical protein